MSRFVLFGLLTVAVSCVEAGPIEIEYWIGEGPNEATLVIDWDEAPGVGPALAWGYRWEGEVTAEDLLRDVLAIDSRLFARMSTLTSIGIELYGFGYDRNADDAFALSDGTPFNSDGVAITGASDGVTAVDADDLYTEGWRFDGFWHNTIASDAAPDWVSAPTGFADRALSNGDREGWVFTPFLNPDGTPRQLEELFVTTPGESVPAPAPRLAGDFNADGRIDAADYTVWRDAEGSTTVVAGAGADADLSSLVDVADESVWRAHYGGPVSTVVSVPEPAAVLQLLLLSFTPLFRCL